MFILYIILDILLGFVRIVQVEKVDQFVNLKNCASNRLRAWHDTRLLENKN